MLGCILYETHEQALTREDVLCKLDKIVKVWVKNISLTKGLNENLVEQANAKIFTFGSYCLGVHGPRDYLDTLCVVPTYATLKEDFFGELQMMLSEVPQVTQLHAHPDAIEGPLLEFNFNGVSVNLVYANLSLPLIPQDLDISQDFVLKYADADTVRTITSYRATDQILRLVPNIQNFRTALRCIRLWAKRRGVYSKDVGYLGGMNWAILVAHICRLYPNALPNTLVSRFFGVYSRWMWPNPVTLSCEIEDGLLALLLGRYHVMPIITPAYPYSYPNSSYIVSPNSSNSVTPTTLQIMKQEFRRGNDVCKDMEANNKADWNALFERSSFFEAYSLYLQIDVTAENDVDLCTLKDHVKSNIRRLANTIEMEPGVLRCHQHPGEYPDALQPFHCSYFIGLDCENDDISAVQRDLVMPVAILMDTVIIDLAMNDGMDMQAELVKQEDIPTFAHQGPRF